MNQTERQTILLDRLIAEKEMRKTMIKAYHNCTLEIAEFIKADGMIRSNAELQSRGIDRCRITGLSSEDTQFVFLYPDFFQHDDRRICYRGDEYVTFIFNAVELVRKYRARVGLDIIEADFHADELPTAEIRKAYRWKGEKALKRLRQGVKTVEKFGVIEILVPQAIPLTDCIGFVNAKTGEPLQGEFHNLCTRAHTQRRRRRKPRRKK